jgi:nucleotide-binding universal stress UspA family protein
MFTKIIVPLDGSELAEQMVSYAVGLAHALSIPVELLHVVDPTTVHVRDSAEHADGMYLDEGNPRAMDVLLPSEITHEAYLDQAMENQESWGRVYLRGLAQRLQSEGKDVATTLVVGAPVPAIVQEAQRTDNALVAMATHGRTGLARLMMGSVAGGVLQHGASPLLLFRPRPGHSAPQQAPRTIIVPLDGSEFGERALPAAAVLGRRLGAKVVLARAVPMHALAPVPAGPGVFLPTDADNDARTYLDTRVHSLCLDRVVADGVVLLGDPTMEIVRLAEMSPDSMVLMTSHGRSGIPRMVLGSVAEEIVRRCASPVLVLKIGG